MTEDDIIDLTILHGWNPDRLRNLPLTYEPVPTVPYGIPTMNSEELLAYLCKSLRVPKEQLHPLNPAATYYVSMIAARDTFRASVNAAILAQMREVEVANMGLAAPKLPT